MTKPMPISASGEPGIYQILNIRNADCYIGKSKNVAKRLSQHRTALRGGYHENIHLQRAWVKYGEFTFEFRLVQTLPVEWIGRAEAFWAHHFADNDTGLPAYNEQDIDEADGYMIISEATREKQRLRMLGSSPSEATRKKISDSLSGENHPNFGKRLPEITKQRMS